MDRLFPFVGVLGGSFQNQTQYTQLKFIAEITHLPYGIGTDAFTGSSGLTILVGEDLFQNLLQEGRIQKKSSTSEDYYCDDALVHVSETESVHGFIMKGNVIIGTDPENPPETQNNGTELVIDLSKL